MLWLFPLLGLCFLAVRLRGAPTTLVVVEFYPLNLRMVCPVRMVVLVAFTSRMRRKRALLYLLVSSRERLHPPPPTPMVPTR